MNMGHFSTFLFARPGFFEGVSRILDFGNTLCEYNHSQNAEDADRNALWADYLSLGEDFRAVLPPLPASQDRVPARVEKAPV